MAYLSLRAGHGRMAGLFYQSRSYVSLCLDSLSLPGDPLFNFVLPRRGYARSSNHTEISVSLSPCPLPAAGLQGGLITDAALRPWEEGAPLLDRQAVHAMGDPQRILIGPEVWEVLDSTCDLNVLVGLLRGPAAKL